MKFPILFTLAFPLTSFAQEPRSAIIVEEDTPVLINVVDQAAHVVSEEINDVSQVVETEVAASQEALENLLGTEPITEGKLPEQPADLKIEKPANEVVLKTEKPKQVTLTGNSNNQFELLSPWAPKPLQQAPQGWQYVPVTADRAYPLEVQLESGKSLDLSVRPYALVPLESKFVIQVREPGYEPQKGYQQRNSVSARLERTTSELHNAAESLNDSIKQLSDLVNSLPK